MSQASVEQTALISLIGSIIIAAGILGLNIFYPIDKAMNIAGFIFLWSLIVSFIGMNLNRLIK